MDSGLRTPDSGCLARERDQQFPLALPERRLHRIRKPLPDPVLDDESVDHDLDAVFDLLVQHRAGVRLVEQEFLAVDAHAGEAGFLGLVEHVLVFALAIADLRRQQQDAAVRRQGHDAIDDLVLAAFADFAAALMAVLDADARPQHAQVVEDLGDGADGGTGILRCGFLFDGDGRRQATDRFVLGLLQLAEKLPGVGRQ